MLAVTGMLDLTEIFQPVKDRFNQRPALEEGLVKWRVVNRFHVLADLGNQLHLTGAQ